MKHSWILALLHLLFGSYQSIAQKEDNTWFLGGLYNSNDSTYKACRLDFHDDTFSITYIDIGLPYDGNNASICDSMGNFLCLSNGENLYNRDYNIMANGSNFYPNSNYVQGVPYIQGYCLVPFPGSKNKVVHISGLPKVVYPPTGPTLGYIELRYAIADIAFDGGLGEVIQRDLIAAKDTLMPGQMMVVRHGNGRDWWLIAPYYLGDKFNRYLLSTNGLTKVGSQTIQTTDLGLGHVCFSPDGQWYARFNWHGIIPDSSFATFELYSFDRCSGLLSSRITKTYDFSGLEGKPGGVAFSPNSRYLYVTRWDSIFQYDLQATDIVASEVTVAVYDFFAGDLGLPTRFFYPLLAPDNKIYICVSNYNSRYLHVIEHPDSAGLACQVRQHALRLPVFNNFLLPNMPFYRLGKWTGSPCDTLGTIATSEAEKLNTLVFELFPNPANSFVHLRVQEPLSVESEFALVNITGQILRTAVLPKGGKELSFDVMQLPSGYYMVQIKTAGVIGYRQKFIVAH